MASSSGGTTTSNPSPSPPPFPETTTTEPSLKFFVTGCQGFIGAYVVNHILNLGHRVVGCDLKNDDGILRQVLSPERLAGLERVYGDVSDGDFVTDAVGRSGATRVIHLAGLQIPTCKANPVLGATVNVIGTINVFEAARIHSVECVAYASSAAVLGPRSDYPGPPPGRCHDNDRHVPRTIYGCFKLCNEGCARMYFADHGVKSVGLRPLTVYGVGREVGLTSGPTKSVKTAVAGKNGGQYAIAFRGNTSWDYVEDVAEIFVRCALSPNVEGAHHCNIAGVNDTVENYIACAQELLGEEGKGITIGDDAIELPFPSDIDQCELERILAPCPVPCTPLREGVRKQIEKFRELKARGELHERDI